MVVRSKSSEKTATICDITKAIFCTILGKSSNQLGFTGAITNALKTVTFRFRLILDEKHFLEFSNFSFTKPCIHFLKFK